jgi:hypothetical protein
MSSIYANQVKLIHLISVDVKKFQNPMNSDKFAFELG